MSGRTSSGVAFLVRVEWVVLVLGVEADIVHALNDLELIGGHADTRTGRAQRAQVCITVSIG
jgi:hypothetical protein